MTLARARLLTATAVLSIASLARTAAAADTTVQVDVSSVIDGRTVSTVANNVVTIWTPGQGIDNDGGPNGYVTNAVEAILKTQGKTEGGKLGIALPDDGMFPADPGGRYPAIQLHFSNAAPITSPQTHSVHHTMGSQTFMFPVPQATYSKMFLLITSSEGTGNLTVTLNYAGGAAAQTMMFKLPDYGVGGAGANDPVYFNLIHGMDKWTTSDTETDGTSHTITGIEIAPTPTAMLSSIQVTKTNGAYVVFWGATGIATSAVATGTGGGGGAIDAGAGGSTGTTDGGAGASGTAGATGTAGTTGTGGDTGAGGTTTGTAGTTTGGTAGATSGGAGTTGGSSTTSTAGTTGTGTTGAAGSTTVTRSSSGGCSLAGTPARGGAAGSAVLIALALVLRKRRRA